MLSIAPRYNTQCPKKCFSNYFLGHIEVIYLGTHWSDISGKTWQNLRIKFFFLFAIIITIIITVVIITIPGKVFNLSFSFSIVHTCRTDVYHQGAIRADDHWSSYDECDDHGDDDEGGEYGHNDGKKGYENESLNDAFSSQHQQTIWGWWCQRFS